MKSIRLRLLLAGIVASLVACGADDPVPENLSCGDYCTGEVPCPAGTECGEVSDGTRACMAPDCKQCLGVQKYCKLGAGCGFVGCGVADCNEECETTMWCTGSNVCLQTYDTGKKCLPAACQPCFDQDIRCDVSSQCGFVECKPLGCSEACIRDAQCQAGTVCVADSLGKQKCLPKECGPCFDQGVHCDVESSSCGFHACRQLECGEACTRDDQCQTGAECVGSGTKKCTPKQCQDCDAVGLACDFEASTCAFKACKVLACGAKCSSTAQCQTGAECVGTSSKMCVPQSCASCEANGLACDFDASTCSFKQCKVLACGTACSSTAQCPAGAECIPNAQNAMECLPPPCSSCAADGLSCNVSPSCGFNKCNKLSCLAVCTSSSQCPDGTSCMTTTSGSQKCMPDACTTCYANGDKCAYKNNGCTFSNCEAGGSGGGGSGGGGSGGGGSGGSGGTCHDRSSCITAKPTIQDNGPDCNGTEMLGDYLNNCSEQIWCTICPVLNGVPVVSDCKADYFNAGAHQYGSYSGWVWCAAYDGTTMKCAAAADPSSCTLF